MYKIHYGARKDGSFDEYDQFMTIGKTGKWDYEEDTNGKLRIFNPTTNVTIFILTICEIEEYFGTREIHWDEITEYVNGQYSDTIRYYYKNK